VEAGRLNYDTNRADFKRGKYCLTNHYRITGDYIRPEDDEIAIFTSELVKPTHTAPAAMPKGHTHLKIR